jgi:glycosyltransferase involved in cell wall biosynthesis
LKRILFVRKSNPQVGGVEMQMLRIALKLRVLNLGVPLLATDDPDGPLAGLFRRNGFDVLACTLSGRNYFLKGVSDIRKITTEQRINILQAHMFRESMLCRFAKMGIPGVKHIYRLETYIDCSPISERVKQMYHLAACFTSHLVDFYFVNGNVALEELRNRSKVMNKNVRVVYNGVEPFGEPDMEEVQLKDDGFLEIAMVANLIQGKGHEMLFEVLKKLSDQNVKIRVFLFGDDMGTPALDGKTYKKTLEDLVNKLGIEKHVVFFGFSFNLREDLKNFRVLILPSYSEGTPNTILEAMSSRKLVVVSDAGELPFMVTHEVSGFVHRIGDGDGLALLLRQIYQCDNYKLDPLRDRAYLAWKERFSLDGMMDQIKFAYT